MLDLIQNVELLKGQCIDFVQSIQTWNVLSVSLNDIDDIIFGSIAFNANICTVDSVLFENGLDSLVIDSVGIDHSGNCNTTLVFLLEFDIWWAFVKPDSKAFKFVFNNFFMLHWPCWIEHDNDEIAGSGHSDDLFTTTFTVLGAFDDTGQIEQLNLRALILKDTGDASQGCELVSSNFGEGSCIKEKRYL